jgi:hypothetical protein
MLPTIFINNKKYTLSRLYNTVIFAKTNDDEVSQKSRRVLLGQLIASGSMGVSGHLSSFFQRERGLDYLQAEAVLKAEEGQ